jgi:hypothetical protein
MCPLGGFFLKCANSIRKNGKFFILFIPLYTMYVHLLITFIVSLAKSSEDRKSQVNYISQKSAYLKYVLYYFVMHLISSCLKQTNGK